MRRLLDLLTGRRRPAPAAAFDAALAPDAPFAAIGDVHGRDDLLARLFDRLDRDHPGRPVILVGDLIDRGEDSAGVIARLRQRPEITVLLGNHEAMLLAFLDDEERKPGRWLRHGGLQMLASYGIGGITPTTAGPAALARARDALRAAMGEAALAWLRDRPLLWRSGNVVVTHAGADPALPPEDQSDELVWGHPRYDRPRGDGLWIVHGHKVVPEPQVAPGRIAIDTGAYATGRLTAALVDPGGVRFLSA
ncbi:metallophosphoesterase [Rubellimicrobium aerolatum]|uniref:Metallophosphoesterase n=1 Tax=Rubellimicrobium aerolatum TaxID=490979 RepID=A0ABW0S974_9RHOB|nr:metallophosphoesterase [Rubellimicrobium aerolatum]MBP1804846.1 serine/threonine protein phosphatase 1 [Rubellimicrobium aerolatum]